MQTADPFYFKPHGEVENGISHFTLQGLLPPDLQLALNMEIRTLLLLAEGPKLLCEQQFSANELSVLLPILESFPHYCPYEVLLSHIFSDSVTTATIARSRQRLQEAQRGGTWPQELRPIRRALSSIRTKLHSFDLEISTLRERGCSLTSLTHIRTA